MHQAQSKHLAQVGHETVCNFQPICWATLLYSGYKIWPWLVLNIIEVFFTYLQHLF